MGPVLHQSISAARMAAILVTALGLLLNACSNSADNADLAGRISPNESNTINRFALANQCLSIHPAQDTRGITILDGGYALSDKASGFFFKPSRLGHYLLYDTDGRYMALNDSNLNRPGFRRGQVRSISGSLFRISLCVTNEICKRQVNTHKLSVTENLSQACHSHLI